MLNTTEKRFFFHFDYYSGWFTGTDNDLEYIFPDIPGGGWIDKVFKYKTFQERVTSPEFMQAFMTEMISHEKYRR